MWACRWRGRRRTSLVLVQPNLERFILNHRMHIARQMVQDLERQVTQRLLRALDALAGVALRERNAQVLAHGFGLALFRLARDIQVGGFGERVEEFHTLAEIWVVDTGLEAETVLDGASVCVE
jgi:hypothetical protein